MTRENTLKRMKTVIRGTIADLPFSWDDAVLNETTSLESLGFDSLTVLDLVYELQQEFKCDGDMRDLAGMETVGDLAVYLEANEGNDS